MRPFKSLTARGKARRLRRLAHNALAAYALDTVSLRLLALQTNVLFRVRTADGTNYVLRVCQPGWRSEPDLNSEAMWLAALARDTDIGAPIPVPARDGRFLVTASAPGVPEPRRCLLMTWLPGQPLGSQLTETNLAAMGTLFARLHAHGSVFKPPPGFTQRRMSGYLARGEPDVLFSDASGKTFTARSRRTLTATRAHVESAFARRYADLRDLCVIHHDLWHGNIIVHRGRLHPLDFEDTSWGFPVQDIGMAFQDLMTDVPPESFDPLCAAFRNGYETLAPWPEGNEGELDAFRAGRMLWVANYVARFQRPYLREHVDRLTPLLERFLATGRLRLG